MTRKKKLLALIFSAFIAQSFIPLYSQSTPSCSGSNIVCPSGQRAICSSTHPGFAECRSLPGFGFLPGCNTCTAFFPDEVICVSSSGTPFSCTTTSSSSSSGGNTATCTNGTIICASGTPACTNNRVGFAECRALPGFGFIPGCNNASGAFFSNEVSCFTAGLPPNAISSSGLLQDIAFCSGGKVFCLDGSSAACTNMAFTPTCVNGFPDCCKEEKNPTTTLVTSLNCNFAFLFCPNTPLGINQFSKVSIDVTSNPKFPDIVDLPLITDEFNNRVGYAYRGSNPSFEINFPAGELSSKIISVDLRDSSGVTFKNIPSIINLEPNNTGKLILTLSLPENISAGRAHFVLNLFNGDSLNGIIQIIDPLEVTPADLKVISKLKIEQIEISGTKEIVMLLIRGKNFLGRRIYVENSNSTKYFENPPGDPHTLVTIFPTNLNVEILQRSVSKDRHLMKVKFKLNSHISKNIKAVLVITTPKGIASKPFTIKLQPVK